MSTRRRARNGYSYTFRDFVTWCRNDRGPIEWDQAEEEADSRNDARKGKGEILARLQPRFLGFGYIPPIVLSSSTVFLRRWEGESQN